MSHDHPKPLTAEQVRIPAGHWLAKLPMIGGGIGVLGVLASLGLAFAGGHGGGHGHGPDGLSTFYFTWLVATLYCLSIALGGLFFVLIQYVTRAGWSVLVRRIAENVAGTIPVFILPGVILFGFGLHTLYHHWSGPEAAHDPILAGKAGYLNDKFFLARTIFYFVVWTLIARRFRNQSLRQDESGDPEITRGLQILSGPSILVFAITMTFAGIDWIMTLDPHWFSTIFGVYFFAGSMVSFLSFLALASMALSAGPLKGFVNTEHFHDIGKLLFGFTVFWTYIGFSQYFLIWYANIPEETFWFGKRWVGSWKSVSVILGVGHFVIPFFFLMARTIKRTPVTLAAGALWMLLMHFVDIYWLVMPNLRVESADFQLADLAALLAIGGLSIAAFGWLMNRAPAAPVKDPRLPESLRFENV